MQTPGEELKALLAARKVRKTDLARRIEALGLGPCSYQNVYRWCRNREFIEENRVRVARALDLPRDHFDKPGASEQREREYQAALTRWLATSAFAKQVADADIDLLRNLPVSATDRRVEPGFFDAVALALSHHLRPNEVGSVAAENVGLDQTLALKPPLKRRRKR